MPKKRSNQLRWSYAEEKYPGDEPQALGPLRALAEREELAETVARLADSYDHPLVCGQEVDQRLGHHPGGSLLALAANATDGKAGIIASPGRRSRLRNLTCR